MSCAAGYAFTGSKRLPWCAIAHRETRRRPCGAFGHTLGKRISFRGYKRAIVFCYLIHGSAYVIFSQMERYWAALLFIVLYRAGVAVSSILNFTHLLRHVPDRYRRRVSSTIESMLWSTMMLSMAVVRIRLAILQPAPYGLVAGICSSSTALFWALASWKGWLVEPAHLGVEMKEVEIHGEPRFKG